MGDTPIPSAVVDEMISFIRDTATARYCMLAATVLYVYDLVTTLDKEVDLVWNRYVALFDCLFNSSGKSNLLTMSSQRRLNCLISIPVPGHQSNEFAMSECSLLINYSYLQVSGFTGENWLKFQSGAAIVIVTVVQSCVFDVGNILSAILVIRLWAMYGRNRWILISITTFGTLQLIANAIIMGKSINYAS
ncbi:hypothetical protein BJ138DRAFT_1106310, partial [Hygrophoropsis aurantiaca]